jgi:DNA-binding SARP family transcriptional activator
VEIRVLGPLEVMAEGQAITIGRRRERGLLGILALHAGALVTFDRLYDLLWEGEPPDSAAVQLRANASRIRTAIAAAGHPDADGLIVTQGRGFVLRVDPAEVDAHRFRRLVATAEEHPPADRARLLGDALALWRGPILAGAVSDQLRDRLAPELDELRCLAVEAKATAELSIGNPQRALTTIRSLSELQPHRESLVRLQMQGLVRAGRRAEAIDAYQRLKNRLAEDLGVDPDPETTELYSAVLRDELPAAGTDAPAQLPPRPSDFTGRDDELAWLLDVIEQRGLIALAGTAGIGKTGLATQLAHRLAAAYPDGQLYANLNGFGASPPLAPLDVLAGFLRSLGVAVDRVPTRVDEAAALFRSLVAQRRMLFLLDNAHSAEQVRPLLPGSAGCLVLVTSRDSLSGLVALDGAQRLVLRPLSIGAAIELLSLIAGAGRLAAEPEPARELAQLCGLLPLALRIAGANLADVPHRTVAGQVSLMRANPLAALEVSGDEARGVRVAFDQSYGALDGPTRRLFRLVSLTPGPDFSLGTAAALTGIRGSADRLRRLVDANLLTLTATGRYAMHDLIRAYARQRLAVDEPDPSAVRDQVARWYVGGAAAAAELLQPAGLRAFAAPPGRFADAEAAQCWLDAERVNLVAAARQYAHEGPAWGSWHLADALGQDLSKRRQPIDLETVTTAARRAADEAESSIGRAVAELCLGRLGWIVAAYSDAQKHYQACAEAAAGVWPHGVAEAHRGLGNVALEAGRLTEAAEHYETALALVDFTEKPHFHGSLTNNLGLVEAHLGQLDAAAARFETVMRWARESGSQVTLGQVLSNLGEVYLNTGRYAEAIPLVEEAVELHRQDGNLGSELICLNQLATARIEDGRPRQAWDLMRAARERAEASDDPILSATILNVQAMAATALRRFEDATRLHEQAMEIAVSVGNNEVELTARLGLAKVAMHLDRYAEADTQAEETADRALAAHLGKILVDCLLLRAEVHRLGGPAVFGHPSREVARGLARQALDEARRSGLRKHAARLNALLEELGNEAATGRP